MNFALPDINLLAVLPELILLAAAVGVLFFRAPGSNGTALGTALAAVALSVLVTPFLYGDLSGTAFSGAVAKDDAALFFIFLADLAVLVALVLSRNDTMGDGNGEAYYGLLLFALFGMHVMISARDLLVLFLGLEILSLPFYVLTGFHRKRKEGLEGAVKYFLLGSFSSALFLLGMALYYGGAGTTSLGALFSAGQPVFLFAGLAFVTAGLAFKIAAVPFHMWAPDVYEGAPLSVAACISVAPKVAAFAVLLHLGLLYAGSGADFFPWAVAAMAAAGMVVGNLAALRQEGLVRMLAYSGIAQAGYILMGLPLLSPEGHSAIAFYLFVYLVMNLGAFAAAITMAAPGKTGPRIIDLAGLASRRPFLAFAMAVFMVSLAGLPPTGGFFAKFFIFKAAVGAGWLTLVLLAVVMSVVSLFYYLKVIVVMYMRPGEGTEDREVESPFSGALIAFMALVTLATGLLPSPLFHGIQSLFSRIIL